MPLSQRPDKYLLLGGSGFIGKTLTARLVRNGSRVRVLSRSPNSFGRGVYQDHELEYAAGDIASQEVRERAIAGISGVVHMVSTIGPRATTDQGVAELSALVGATVDIMKLCSTYGVGKLVFISSGGAIYGEPDTLPITELHALRPKSVYGHSKQILESCIQFYGTLLGIDATILRVSNPFGPFQDFRKGQGIVAAVLDCLRTGREFNIFGDGTATRDYIFIDDVATAIVMALKKSHVGTVNISSGSGLSINDVISAAESVTKRTLRRHYIPGAATDVHCSVLCNARAKVHLEWEPTTDFEHGIARTWDWLNHISESEFTNHATHHG